MRTILAICQATPEEKQIYTRPENGMTNVFLSRESSRGWSSGDELQDETHNKNRSARYSLVWPDHFFHY